jgi:hypothetical protein
LRNCASRRPSRTGSAWLALEDTPLSALIQRWGRRFTGFCLRSSARRRFQSIDDLCAGEADASRRSIYRTPARYVTPPSSEIPTPAVRASAPDHPLARAGLGVSRPP